MLSRRRVVHMNTCLKSLAACYPCTRHARLKTKQQNEIIQCQPRQVFKLTSTGLLVCTWQERVEPVTGLTPSPQQHLVIEGLNSRATLELSLESEDIEGNQISIFSNQKYYRHGPQDSVYKTPSAPADIYVPSQLLFIAYCLNHIM